MAAQRRQNVRRLKALSTAAAVLVGAWTALAAAPAGAGQSPKEDLISGSDLLCLAMNVYREARNQPIEGQVAVAYVTLNRFEASHLPTICDVVFKAGYFAWTRDKKIVGQWPRDEAAWETAQRVARSALADPEADPVKGSTYFHAVSIQPDWVPEMVRVGRIGDHVFYRPKNLAAVDQSP